MLCDANVAGIFSKQIYQRHVTVSVELIRTTLDAFDSLDVTARAGIEAAVDDAVRRRPSHAARTDPLPSPSPSQPLPPRAPSLPHSWRRTGRWPLWPRALRTGCRQRASSRRRCVAKKPQAEAPPPAEAPPAEAEAPEAPEAEAPRHVLRRCCEAPRPLPPRQRQRQRQRQRRHWPMEGGPDAARSPASASAHAVCSTRPMTNKLHSSAREPTEGSPVACSGRARKTRSVCARRPQQLKSPTDRHGERSSATSLL